MYDQVVNSCCRDDPLKAIVDELRTILAYNPQCNVNVVLKTDNMVLPLLDSCYTTATSKMKMSQELCAQIDEAPRTLSQDLKALATRMLFVFPKLILQPG